MSVSVDLSSAELHPESVVRFIKAHVTDRPDQDLLFKVSPQTLELYCGQKPANAIPVSADELLKLNAALHGSYKANEFLKRAAHLCSKCGRTFTFFDFFETGRAHHGEAYIDRVLGDGASYVHIQKRDNKIPVVCTNCGTTNVLAPEGYDGPQY